MAPIDSINVSDQQPGLEIINKVNLLHNQAMEMADLGIVQKIRGDIAASKKSILQAFLLEKEAAELLLDFKAAEPSRSILFRSAASLAIDAEKNIDAIRLITIALKGNPPDEIREELLELIVTIADRVDQQQVLHELGAPGIVLLVRHYIKEHINIQECSIIKLSQHFNINPSVLARQFKSTFHVSLTSFVRQQCMIQAEELLRNSDLSIQTIADQLGYSSIANFVKQFRIYSGVAPQKAKHQANRSKDEGSNY